MQSNSAVATNGNNRLHAVDAYMRHARATR